MLMKQIDITIRKNSERKSFSVDWGNGQHTIIPPFIGIANTEKGVWYERYNGSPDTELGKEYPRSIKGERGYTYLNDKLFFNLMDIEKGLTVDLCGTIITAEKTSPLHLENVADPLFD